MAYCTNCGNKLVGERIYMKGSWDTYEEAIEYAK